MKKKQPLSDEALLNAALRTRPESLARLAALVHLSTEQTAEALTRLHQKRLIDFDGERIAYRSPADATAEVILGLLHEQLDSTRRLLATVGSITEHLSESLGSAASNAVGEDSVPIRVFHGPEAMVDSIEALIDSSPLSDMELLCALPGLRPEYEEQLHHIIRRWSAFSGKVDRVRMLLPLDTRLKGPPPGQTRFDGRMLMKTPSWFWIHPGGGEIALPLTWGDSFPTTTVVLTHASAASLAEALFTALWDRAVPVKAPEDQTAWEPLMQLMRQGMTLDAAAERLGINPRTARRRLTAAMDHYGVETMFGLAAAWGAELAGGHVPELAGGEHGLM